MIDPFRFPRRKSRRLSVSPPIVRHRVKYVLASGKIQTRVRLRYFGLTDGIKSMKWPDKDAFDWFFDLGVSFVVLGAAGLFLSLFIWVCSPQAQVPTPSHRFEPNSSP
jgi:hypothetical protein